MSDVIKSYLANIERELNTGKATEHSHRPALKDLLEGLGPRIKVINEPKPDLRDGKEVDIELARKNFFSLLKGWMIDSKSLKDELREING